MKKKHLLFAGDADEDFYVLLDHIPLHDEGILSNESFSRPGGKASNSAVVFSSLGGNASLFAVVGSDSRGDIALLNLDKSGVGKDLIVRNENKTTLCIMMLDKSGEKAIIVLPSEDIYPSEKFKYVLKGREGCFDHVHLIGLNPEKVEWIALWAKGNGMSISVDIDSANGGLDRFSSILKLSDITFMNKQGLFSLVPSCSDVRNALEKISSFTSGVLVSTLGREGAALLAGGVEYHRVDAEKIDPLDTTGCGDAFSAGFLHAIYNLKYPFDGALKIGTKCASVSALDYGGQSGNWKLFERGGK